MRTICARTLLLAAVTLFSAGLCAVGSAQTPAGWETIRPDQEFTVLIPIGSTNEAGEYLYHQRTLKTHLFVSNSKPGPVLAVATMTGIKANPALYSEAQRLNSYVDAFKGWFPSKVRGTGVIAKLTVAGEKKLNGHTGREYRLTIGDLNGTAQFFVTRKRLYAIVALSAKKDDPLPEQFLSSFVIPEKGVEAPANVAVKSENQQAPAGQADPSAAVKPVDAPKPNAETGEAPAKPVEATGGTEGQPSRRAPISGGVLNGKALSLPQPPYPPIARNSKVSGMVVVQVTIDEYGNVIEANAVSGHPLLRAAAVAAAREAKFSQTSLMGELVRVTGVLQYNFVDQ